MSLSRSDTTVMLFASASTLLAQEAPKPHLLRSPSRKPPDTRARTLNQGCMQSSPPFSRRRSPNRPSPNSIAIDCSANQSMTHGISRANCRQLRCVHTIAPTGGEGGHRKAEPVERPPHPDLLPASGGGIVISAKVGHFRLRTKLSEAPGGET